MNYFKIFAHGKKFNVDKFIEISPLKIDYVWKKGDQKRYAPTDIPSPHETSGIEIVLGEGTKLNRFEQDAIAVEFMEENLEALKELSAFPGVDNITLGIHFLLELEVNTTAQF